MTGQDSGEAGAQTLTLGDGAWALSAAEGAPEGPSRRARELGSLCLAKRVPQWDALAVLPFFREVFKGVRSPGPGVQVRLVSFSECRIGFCLEA